MLKSIIFIKTIEAQFRKLCLNCFGEIFWKKPPKQADNTAVKPCISCGKVIQ